MKDNALFSPDVASPFDIDRAAERAPEYPRTVWGKAKYTIQYFRGVFGLALVGLRERTACAEAKQLGDSLERTVFPVVHAQRDRHLVIEIDREKPLSSRVMGTDRTFPGTEKLSAKLQELGVRRLILDTRLEDGQVLDACRILYYAQHRVVRTPFDTEHTEAYSGWNRRKMASALRSPGGLHLRCQSMYLADDGTYRVDYSYCDLFLTSIVRNYMTRRGKHNDHRRLFGAAPWVGFAVVTALALPIAAFFVHPIVAFAVYLIAAIIIAGVTATLVYTIGSIQYARENYDTLSQELMEQVIGLSRFPEINPNLVAKAGRDGTIRYLNPAGRRLYVSIVHGIDDTGSRLTGDIGEDELLDHLQGTIFPSDFSSLVAAAFTGNVMVEREYRIKTLDRIFQYTLTPFPEDKSVIVVGTDVTQLRRLNEDLEARVNARTQELRQTQDVTIMSLAGLAESRDPETGQHLERTRWYVRLLAEELSTYEEYSALLNDETILLLFKSAPLHDIGKVGIPDRVLLKPGRLDTNEFREMQRHTEIGSRALRRALDQLGEDSFLAMGEQIARYHHERWDGAGYPEGLRGRDIPLPARLMALADVYDALTSPRVYKKAFPHEEARKIILSERGRQFEPAIVDAFLRLEAQFVEIHAGYSE